MEIEIHLEAVFYRAYVAANHARLVLRFAIDDELPTPGLAATVFPGRGWQAVHRRWRLRLRLETGTVKSVFEMEQY